MTPPRLVLVAALGSGGLLLAAWAFQYIGGLAPCSLCIWQRYPHGAAVAAGVLMFAFPALVWTLAGALAAAASGAIGIYHSGVERGWWEGPSTCSAADVGGMSADELFDQIMAAPLVRCDEVAWQMFGLSMASWNAVVSFALAALWIAAAVLLVSRGREAA